MRFVCLALLLACGSGEANSGRSADRVETATEGGEAELQEGPRVGLCAEEDAVFCIDVPEGTTAGQRFPSGLGYTLPGGQELDLGFDEGGTLEDALTPDGAGHDISGTFFDPDMIESARELEDPAGMYWRVNSFREDDGSPAFFGASIRQAPGGVVSCTVGDLGASDVDPCATLRAR